MKISIILLAGAVLARSSNKISQKFIPRLPVKKVDASLESDGVKPLTQVIDNIEKTEPNSLNIEKTDKKRKVKKSDFLEKGRKLAFLHDDDLEAPPTYEEAIQGREIDNFLYSGRDARIEGPPAYDNELLVNHEQQFNDYNQVEDTSILGSLYVTLPICLLVFIFLLKVIDSVQ